MRVSRRVDKCKEARRGEARGKEEGEMK